MSISVRVRLFAIQRELAGTREVPLELADGADVEAAWAALVARHPVLAPGRASLRFARNGDYADPTTALADGDEVAMIPPVSGGSGDDDGHRRRRPTPTRILELRETPFTTAILAELADALAVPEDGAVVGFLGRTRSTPGTPAPGQEAEAARHAGRSVDSLEYEALDTLALRTLADDRRRDRGPVRGRPAGDRPPHRRGAARRAVDRGRGRRAAPRRRLRCGALRHRRDEGASPDLEGRAVRRRACLDRPPGANRS